MMKVPSILKVIKEARPLFSIQAERLQGLNNILTQPSTIINPNTKKELLSILKSNGINYYYVKLENNTKTPYYLRYLHYANGMKKEEPNNLFKLDLEGFKFYAYAVTYLTPDNNGFYFVINQKDVIRFFQLIRKANNETPYQKRSREYDYEILEDALYAEDIKHSYEYDKIFSKLDEYKRKKLFTYLKEAGLNKKERKLLKTINQTHIKSFEVTIEELEEELKAIETTPRPITYAEEQELRKYEEKIYKEYLRLTEEDNSWNNFTTTLEDYL